MFTILNFNLNFLFYESILQYFELSKLIVLCILKYILGYCVMYTQFLSYIMLMEERERMHEKERA
jgi:hypothetical protein